VLSTGLPAPPRPVLKALSGLPTLPRAPTRLDARHVRVVANEPCDRGRQDGGRLYGRGGPAGVWPAGGSSIAPTPRLTDPILSAFARHIVQQELAEASVLVTKDTFAGVNRVAAA